MPENNVGESAKVMRLRYSGRCRDCARELPAGESAVYHRDSKTVSCVSCISEVSSTSPVVHEDARSEPVPPATDVFAGVAGASARRENERRKQRREMRIRGAHPIMGGIILALSDDPQSTRAWATGARGEEVLGSRLDTLVSDGVHVLHDRRVPRTVANIDHIVVCPTGVFVIDAKKYTGRPSRRVEGGLFGPRRETLIVGSRNCTKLVDGVHKQVGLVATALFDAGLGQVPVSGMLCFVEADWPMLGGDFTIDGVRVLWPKKAAGLVARPGEVDAQTAALIHQTLALSFPSA